MSPTMTDALWAIVNRPGDFPNTYPGGIRTVRALERRGLVRFDGTAVFPTAPGLRRGHAR